MHFRFDGSNSTFNCSVSNESFTLCNATANSVRYTTVVYSVNSDGKKTQLSKGLNWSDPILLSKITIKPTGRATKRTTNKFNNEPNREGTHLFYQYFLLNFLFIYLEPFEMIFSRIYLNCVQMSNKKNYHQREEYERYDWLRGGQNISYFSAFT